MPSKRPTSEPKLFQKVPCAGRTEGRVFSMLKAEHVCVAGSAAEYVVTLRRATVSQFQDLWPAQEVWTKLLHVPNLSDVNEVSNTRKAAGGVEFDCMNCAVQREREERFINGALVSWPKTTGRHRPNGLTASRHSSSWCCHIKACSTASNIVGGAPRK